MSTREQYWEYLMSFGISLLSITIAVDTYNVIIITPNDQLNLMVVAHIHYVHLYGIRLK